MRRIENVLIQKGDGIVIRLEQKGDFKTLTSFLERIKGTFNLSILDSYGREGVAALSAATPVDTGLTAASWNYRINRTPNSISLEFYNTNIQNGCPIAIILQYGHATGNGGYVQGRDYINPAIRPIFEKIAESAWREVTRV